MKVRALRNTFVEGQLLRAGKTYDIESDVSYMLRTGKLEKVEAGKTGKNADAPAPVDPVDPLNPDPDAPTPRP